MSDIDTVVMDRPKALDPKRPIGEAKTLSRPRKPVVNFGLIGATTAFGYRVIDPIGVEFPCVISAAL